jgi:hypothetical protein
MSDGNSDGSAAATVVSLEIGDCLGEIERVIQLYEREKTVMVCTSVIMIDLSGIGNM